MPFRLSVSMKEGASEYLFQMLHSMYMNFYLFHISFIPSIFLSKTCTMFYFYILNFIIGRHTWDDDVFVSLLSTEV